MAAEEFPLFYSTDTVGGTGNDRLNSLDGNSYSLAGFQRDAIINDLNNSDRTDDRDTDDTARDGDSLESWVVNGVEKNLLEIATYNNSTIYTNDGTEVTVDVLILLYDDGTVAFTTKNPLNGSSNNISSLNPQDVDLSMGITLGAQNSSEADGIAGFQNYRDFFVCFTAGTLIQTDNGVRPIEELRVGDLILTRDNGLQPIRWIGSSKFSSAQLSAAPNIRPIRIKAGALGKDSPSLDLTVSPQHRILVRSKIAQRMFGTDEVLVAAKHLLECEGIEIAEDLGEVEYFHMLFNQHEVIYSNGAETESLHTGPQALKSVGPAAQEEIFTIFPELRDCDPAEARPLARPSLTGREGRNFAKRSSKNSQPLFS